MKSTLSNAMTLTVVALSMMIAAAMYAGAQTVPGSGKSVRGRVVGGVVTVVNKSGSALQSNDGGKNWQTVGSVDARDMAAAVEQAKVKRQRLLAEVAAMKQSKTMAASEAGTATVSVTASQPLEMPKSVSSTDSEVAAKP